MFLASVIRRTLLGQPVRQPIDRFIGCRSMSAPSRYEWLLCLAAVALLAIVASARLALAVSPLVIDDADTEEPGHLQLNAGWQFSRTGSVSLQSIPVNPVFGISSRAELGATFGYQWRDGSGSVPTHADGESITDLTLATKWRLWQHSPADGFKVSGRLDLKLPTASERHRFGTGHVDVSAVVIGTRDWTRTSVDWNVGYTAVDASRSVFGDDRWLLGQAVRHRLTERWTVIGEAYAVLPQGNEATPANGHFDGGAQLALRENVLLSALVGTGVGRDTSDLTGYLGFTWEL